MRRRAAIKREVIPDPVYGNKLVSRFVNIVMVQGKKSIAEKIVYNCFDIISKKLNKEPVEVFEKALDNARPLLIVKPRRVGGATYQVPMEVDKRRGIFLAMMWIRNFARTRKGKPMEQKLADELMEAYNRQGSAIKKREDTHKMAEANRAFSHFKW